MLTFKITFQDGSHVIVKANDYVEAKYKALLIKYQASIIVNIKNIVAIE